MRKLFLFLTGAVFVASFFTLPFLLFYAFFTNDLAGERLLRLNVFLFVSSFIVALIFSHETPY